MSIQNGPYSEAYEELESKYSSLYEQKQEHIREMLTAIETNNDLDLDHALQEIQDRIVIKSI